MSDLRNNLNLLMMSVDSNWTDDIKFDYDACKARLKNTHYGNLNYQYEILKEHSNEIVVAWFIVFLRIEIERIPGSAINIFQNAKYAQGLLIKIINRRSSEDITQLILEFGSTLGYEVFIRTLTVIMNPFVSYMIARNNIFSSADLYDLQILIQGVRKPTPRLISVYTRNDGKGAFTREEEKIITHWLYKRPDEINLKLLVWLRLLYETGSRIVELVGPNGLRFKDVTVVNEGFAISVKVGKKKKDEIYIVHRPISKDTYERVKKLYQRLVDSGANPTKYSYVFCRSPASIFNVDTVSKGGRKMELNAHAPDNKTFLNNALKFGSNWKHIFPLVKPITESDSFGARNKKINLSALRFRHNHVARMIEAGMPRQGIQHQLGQESKEIVNAYVDVSKRSGELITNALNSDSTMIGRIVPILNGEKTIDEVFGPSSGKRRIKPVEIIASDADAHSMFMGTCQNDSGECMPPEIECLACREFKPLMTLDWRMMADRLSLFLKDERTARNSSVSFLRETDHLRQVEVAIATCDALAKIQSEKGGGS